MLQKLTTTSVPIMYTKKRILKAKVITVIKIKNVIFWDKMLCNLIEGYQHFNGTYHAPRCPLS